MRKAVKLLIGGWGVGVERKEKGVGCEARRDKGGAGANPTWHWGQVMRVLGKPKVMVVMVIIALISIKTKTSQQYIFMPRFNLDRLSEFVSLV